MGVSWNSLCVLYGAILLVSVAAYTIFWSSMEGGSGSVVLRSPCTPVLLIDGLGISCRSIVRSWVAIHFHINYWSKPSLVLVCSWASWGKLSLVQTSELWLWNKNKLEDDEKGRTILSQLKNWWHGFRQLQNVTLWVLNWQPFSIGCWCSHGWPV